MAITTKEILGVPYFFENSLKLDVIMLYTEDNFKVKETSATVTLIKDIWKDLQENEEGQRTLDVSGGEYSVELKIAKKYWYYRVKYTNPDPEATELNKYTYIDISIPTPKPETFKFDFSESVGDTKWSLHWKSIMKSVYDSSFNKENAMFPSKNMIAKTQYVEYQKPDGTFSGEIKSVDSQLWERESPLDTLGGLMASLY